MKRKLRASTAARPNKKRKKESSDQGSHGKKKSKTRRNHSASVVVTRNEIIRKYKTRSSANGLQSSVSKTTTSDVESGSSSSCSEEDIGKMKMDLEAMETELSMYSREYAAATTPEQKNLLRAAMTVTRAAFNSLNSKLETALRLGNIKY